MHILGIVGSPRLNGATNVLVDEILSGVRTAGGTIDKIFISDYKLSCCIACMGCKKHKKCVINDDWVKISEKILNADGFVIGTPVYWNTVSAQVKLVMDRCFSFLDENLNSSLNNKISAIVITCGAPDIEMTNVTRETLESFMQFNKIKVIDTLIAKNMHNVKDALNNQELMAKAFQIGRKFI